MQKELSVVSLRGFLQEIRGREAGEAGHDSSLQSGDWQRILG